MIRRRNLLIILLIFLALFILTTNYLLTILVSSEKEVGKQWTIQEKIYGELKKLPGYYIKKQLRDESEDLIDILINSINSDIDLKNTNLSMLWEEANKWVSKIQLVNLSSPKLGQVFFALKNAKIIEADVDIRGTQLKLLLTLEGNQKVVFKPQWYNINKVIEGPVYAGKDRYGSEIIGFYLSVILNKLLTPISVERKISLKRDIIPVATKRLLDTIFERHNKTCVYGKCYYCRKEDPVCENDTLFLNGTVIFNIKLLLINHRSPWQRTYKNGKRALWEEFPANYCKTVKEKLSKKRIYDLVDTSIFDFFIQNGDRHHYETLDDTVIWIDNGKGLGNPKVHHIDILAPLYQCCMLRRETLKTLLNLTGGKLREKLESIPNITNFITEDHLRAIDERLLIIFAAIEYCRHKDKKEK